MNNFNTLHISAALYIFLSFNREINLPLDPRLLNALVLIILVANFFFRNGPSERLSRTHVLYIVTVTIFVYFRIFSNIKWVDSSLDLRSDVLINLIFLDFYNFIFILVLYLYRTHLSTKTLANIINFSGWVLFVSMIITYFEVPLPLAGDIREAKSFDLSITGTRVGGYAEDPNYASLLILIWYVSNLITKTGRKYVNALVLLTALILSFSKTIILTMIIYFLFNIFGRFKWFIALLVLISILPFTILQDSIRDLINSLSTLSIRFIMAEAAIQSIMDNPIWGTGLSSVRSNFENQGGWYVQPHNTYLSIGVDSGLVALSSFLIAIVARTLSASGSVRYLYVAILFFMLSYDISAFPFLFITFGVMPLLLRDCSTQRYNR